MGQKVLPVVSRGNKKSLGVFNLSFFTPLGRVWGLGRKVLPIGESISKLCVLAFCVTSHGETRRDTDRNGETRRDTKRHGKHRDIWKNIERHRETQRHTERR